MQLCWRVDAAVLDAVLDSQSLVRRQQAPADIDGISMPCGRRAAMMPIGSSTEENLTQGAWLCAQCARSGKTPAVEANIPSRVLQMWPLIRGSTGKPIVMKTAGEGRIELILPAPPPDWWWPSIVPYPTPLTANLTPNPVLVYIEERGHVTTRVVYGALRSYHIWMNTSRYTASADAYILYFMLVDANGIHQAETLHLSAALEMVARYLRKKAASNMFLPRQLTSQTSK